MSLIEKDVLANESAARLMFCINAQKKKLLLTRFLSQKRDF